MLEAAALSRKKRTQQLAPLRAKVKAMFAANPTLTPRQVIDALGEEGVVLGAHAGSMVNKWRRRGPRKLRKLAEVREPRKACRPTLTGAEVARRTRELAGKRREAKEYFEANPDATPSEVGRLLDVSPSTVGGWRSRLMKKTAKQAATNALGKERLERIRTDRQPPAPLPTAPASLKGEAVKLRDELRDLLTLAEKAIPAIEVLGALEKAMSTITNLRVRMENIIAQRDSIQHKFLERNMATPGD